MAKKKIVKKKKKKIVKKKKTKVTLENIVYEGTRMRFPARWLIATFGSDIVKWRIYRREAPTFYLDSIVVVKPQCKATLILMLVAKQPVKKILHKFRYKVIDLDEHAPPACLLSVRFRRRLGNNKMKFSERSLFDSFLTEEENEEIANALTPERVPRSH